MTKITLTIVILLVMGLNKMLAELPAGMICDDNFKLDKCVLKENIKGSGAFNLGVHDLTCGSDNYVLKVIDNNSKTMNDIRKLIKYDNVQPSERLRNVKSLLKQYPVKNVIPLTSVCKSDLTFAIMPKAEAPTFDYQCFRDIRYALLTLHKSDLVHNDIKAENIMKYNGKCVLIDHDSICNEDEFEFVSSKWGPTSRCLISSYLTSMKNKKDGDWFMLLKTMNDNNMKCVNLMELEFQKSKDEIDKCMKKSNPKRKLKDNQLDQASAPKNKKEVQIRSIREPKPNLEIFKNDLGLRYQLIFGSRVMLDELKKEEEEDEEDQI